MKLTKPDLKLSGAKPPAALADVYYDLRDRRLLPLVALVVVAIAAVPFLLGNDEEEAVLPPPAAATETLEALAKGSDELTVVEARPGLRDYRKRLKGSPTDPFDQKYTGAAGLDKAKLGGGEGGGGGGEGDETTETTVTTEGDKVSVTETSEPGKGRSGGDGTGGATPQAPAGSDGKLLTIGINVKITRADQRADGSLEWRAPTVRRNVPPLASLPGRKAPVITYTGFNPQTKKILWSVSHGVSSIYGDGVCLAGQETCDVLEVEPGFPQEFVYGPNKVHYRMVIVDVNLIRVKRLGK